MTIFCGSFPLAPYDHHTINPVHYNPLNLSKTTYFILSHVKILWNVIRIECIDLWTEFGAISCEALIRLGCAWDQEVTFALSVIAVVWPETLQTPLADKIN